MCLSNYYHLFQYKEDLSSDEEIFAEKTKEIESLKETVRGLEEEKAKLVNQLLETQTRLKKHEDQLFQQQLQLNQLLLNQGIAPGTVMRSFVCFLVDWLVVLESFVTCFVVGSLVGWLVGFVRSFFVYAFVPSSAHFSLFVRSFFREWVDCSFFCLFVYYSLLTNIIYF